MANTPRKYMTSDEVAPAVPVWFHFNVGTLTSDTTFKFTAPFDGCILDAKDVILGWGNSPTAAAKSITGDVKLGSVVPSTVFSTKPQVLGTAAANKSTLEVGTGIRQPVLKEALTDRSFVRSEQITVEFDESTASGDPTYVSLSVGLTPFQDKEPDIRIPINS